jgi:hypothetical protein
MQGGDESSAFVERRAWARRRCVVLDERLPPTLTMEAPPSIVASVTLLHWMASAVAGGRGGSGGLIWAAEGDNILAFVWRRVDDAPCLV